MRHIRTRRRFKLILITLFVVCIMLFIESRIESFVPHLKSYAESRIEDALGGKLKFSIGSIDGGILRPFTFNDIKISNRKDGALLPSIDINNIRTNYRLWHVLLNRRDYSFASVLPFDSHVYINFTTRNKDLSGFIGFEGDLLDSKVKGYITLFDRDRIDFIGRVKEDSFDIEIKSAKGAIEATANVLDDGELNVEFKIKGLKLNGFDIAGDGSLKNKIVMAQENPKLVHLDGKLETRNLILNHKPFLNLKASYKVSNGVLEIPDLKLGDSFSIYGKAALKKPYNIDAVLLADNVSLSWLLLSLGVRDAASIISGTMNGKFKLKGPVKNLKLDAHMEIRKGTLSVVDFEYLTANLKGDLPFVRIEDSRITRESGYFTLAGEMDLRRIGKGNFFDDIRMTSDDKAITWDGWDTRKAQDVQEVRMKKRLSEDINIDVKKFIAEERIDESIRDADEVRLEYKLHPHDSLKMMVGQDRDFLGFEHKDKF